MAPSPPSDLPLPDYERLDATALAGLMASGALHPSAVLEAAIARLERARALNAIAMTHFEMARAEAARLGARSAAQRQDDATLAPLSGVPFLLKDLGLALQGTITTQGCAFFKDAVADHDSTLVQRYRSAGLNIFGKTTTPEFGQTATTESRLFGLTRNPWSRELSAGGSSGGAAVAVASGIVPVAHASDGGGSIRIPASHCGVFGLKPSRGRVPMGPKIQEGWMGLSSQNVISRTVRDSALFLQISQGPEAGSRTRPPVHDLLQAIARPPARLRIALMLNNPFGMPVHPDCLAAAQFAAACCEALGHKVEVAQPTLAVGELFQGMGVATATGMLSSVRAREAVLGRSAREEEFEPLNWRSLQLAQGYRAEQVFQARQAFDTAGRTLDLFFEGFDVILSPVTAAPAPALGAMSLDQAYESFVQSAMMASPFTALFNMSGHPAMSVPLHWNAAAMPFGAHFAGGYGQEATLLALAAQLEAAHPWAHRRAPL